MCLGIVGFNLMLWRRMRVALAQRRDWTEADFVSSLTGRGCAGPSAAVVLQILKPYYSAGVVPKSHDSFARFLAVDAEEIQDLVEQAFAALGLPMPTASDPEQIPVLVTVGDLAMYLNDRYSTLSAGRQREAPDATDED